MILLVNPRATRPSNRRFPLSVMSIGAALPESVSWEIVDGNRPDVDPLAHISAEIDARSGAADPVEVVAFTVMPGPQLVNAVPLARDLKARHPSVPIVWGGNFPSLYPAPVLNAPYVDWIVRGQGEQTFAELLEVVRGRRDPTTVAGLSFRESDGTHRQNPERPWVGPNDLPAPPYHKIDVADYLRPTYLGRRSGVYQSSVGCPYGCKFCGVISVFGSREKMQVPARTAEHLGFLTREHGMDAVHFYDNNFFVREDDARELAERIMPLGLKWWCEARVDALCRFSDDTWRLLRRSGFTMVFCGAEAGSDDVLERMNKGITTAQVLEVAARAKQHGVIPEFSFVFGGPHEPEREIETTLAFIRRLKDVNPAMELITYWYTPTPQRRGTYGDVDALAGTPDTLEEWTNPEWVAWMTHERPRVPWLNRALRRKVEDFTLVLESRFPSVQDHRTAPWGKTVGRLLARRRWSTGQYTDPTVLRLVRTMAQRVPDDAQAYGHLRRGRTA
ncbi:MAG: B12-binding domain-containing radical SAM protein [Gemmatimonadaceae bacterium]